jgi:hypothetical protein
LLALFLVYILAISITSFACIMLFLTLIRTFMALKSTIYKAELQIADMDRHYYAQHSLTLAKHPSETEERLMVRLIAFALFANESLTFGKGLSDDDEPDLWQKDLTGAIELWMNVGLPDEREIRKACGRAKFARDRSVNPSLHAQHEHQLHHSR